ncbi:MAG TPA: sugar phosphate nucleotidyltransferase [Patescibacteria group bacterium]|nr:sugar phosphate nucleotidyltransferase [Patescibacteria group bacterium]
MGGGRMAEAPAEFETKVLIMCGGKGTRMWPISNLNHPKQFESLLGNQSMFRQTVERVLTGFKPEDIYIATSESFGEHLIKQAPEVPETNFVLEPAMRDNLGAVGLATAVINKRHPKAVMIMLWGADHLVQKPEAFMAAIKQAAELAHKNEVIVHVDTPPTYPSVHNGWIKIGEQREAVNGHKVYDFEKQVEKPDEATAKKFFADKSYLIHVGYMAFKPSLLLSYYQKYAPVADKILQKIAPTIDTPEFIPTLKAEYPKFEKQSVDYGLFEKLPPKSQWELPADMGWVDVGTWELLYQGLPKDKDGNVIINKSKVNLIDTRNSLIIGKDEGIVGVIGLEGMIVVDTTEGLLVCPMNQAPKVKELYSKLYE